MIFDLAPLPFYADSGFLITICIVACIIVLILIAYFAYRFIKQKKLEKLMPEDLEKNIAYTTCVTAQNVGADAIVAYTHKGDSVRMIAGMGPGCPIFAVTDNEKTYYQLAVTWNVTPILIKDGKTIEDTIQKGIAKLEEEGILEKGDKVVLAGGPKILPAATENKVIGGVARV